MEEIWKYLVMVKGKKKRNLYKNPVSFQNDVKTALTFSDPSMVKYFRDQMAEVVGAGVDLLFCNEEEALLYTGAATIEIGGREYTRAQAALLGEETALDLRPFNRCPPCKITAPFEF